MSRSGCSFSNVLFLLTGLVFILPSARAGVDVLSAGGDVYLTWSQGNSSILEICGSAVSRSFSASTVQLGEGGPGFQNLLVSAGGYYPDIAESLMVLDPTSLETVMSRRVDPEELVGEGNLLELRVARHDANDTGMWVTGRISQPTGGVYLWSMSMRFVPDPEQGITLDQLRYFIFMMPYGTYDPVHRPLFCGSQDVPTYFTRLDYYWHGDRFDVYSAVHQPPSLRDPIDYYTICSYSYVYSPVYLKASGSCADEVLCLWARTDTLKIYCSYLDGLDPEPVQTSLLPFDLPPEEPWAMSCNRDDQGLLLAWVDSGSVICRHYQDGWSAEEHILAEGIGSVEEDFLSVCSDSLGYWVAWLDDQRAEPELVFVPRDSVSGIDQHGPVEPPDISVVPICNPASGVVELLISCGNGEPVLDVFDISGRLVYREESVLEGVNSFDAPSRGIYLVRVHSGSTIATCRLTVI